MSSYSNLRDNNGGSDSKAGLQATERILQEPRANTSSRTPAGGLAVLMVPLL